MNHKQISDKLIINGHQAFLVGGAVRDQFLGREAKDFDIATDAIPDEILNIFPAGKKIGAHFPVILVGDVEIATFRTEVARGRHDVDITFVKTIEEDLSRRDFTFNAMAINMVTGELVDPFAGKFAIERKAIRFVGNANDRIIEDPVRMLRAIRFAAEFDFEIDFIALDAIRNHNGCRLVNTISNERVRIEFEKMILGKNPEKALRILNQTGLLEEIFPEFSKTHVDQNRHHDETVFEHSMMALGVASKMRASDILSFRLAALFHDIGKPATRRFDSIKKDVTFFAHESIGGTLARKILRRLTFDNLTIKRVEFLIREHMFFFTEETRLSRVKKRIVGAEKFGLNIRDLMRLRIVDRRSNLAKRNRSKITRAFKRTLRDIRNIEVTDAALKVTDLAINGHDLMAMGFKPGPLFREILEAVFVEVLEDKLPNERLVQLAFINRSFRLD